MVKWEDNKAWFLVLPVFLVVAFSAVIPLMTVVNYSVQDILGPGSRVFVGDEWYRDVLTDSRLHEALWRQIVYSFCVLAIEVPLGIGVALIVGVVLNYIIKPAGSPSLLFGGVAVVLLAIIVTALAHAAHSAAKRSTAPPAPQTVAGARAVQRPGAKRAGGHSPWKGISLSLAAGLLMGLFYPLVEMSKKGDLGLGPYAAAFCFAMGILVSTPIFNLFFMNLPVEGDPVSFRQYLLGTPKQHLLGVAGGVIWCTGTIANFVAASAPPSVNVGPAISYAIGQGATLVSTLWGLLVWKEFEGATPGVRGRIALMLILYVAGLAMLSLAPLFN